MRSFPLLAAVALSGCAFSTMSPAHRLEAGEVVVQGAIDEPGFLYIPRVSGAVTVGVGDLGDVGIHAGTTILTVNGGATVRGYVARELALSLQGDVFLTTFEDGFFSSGRLGAVTLTPRFGRVLTDSKDRVYGGIQSSTILPINVGGGADIAATNAPAIGFGGYVGAAFDTIGDWDVQIEFSGSPVGFAKLDESDSYRFTPMPIVQFGIGLQYRKERDVAPVEPSPPDAAPRPAPTRAQPGDNTIL